MLTRNLALVSSSLILLSACATGGPPSIPAYGTFGDSQLFMGMGKHQHKVTTESPEAQQYFNQGLNWMYAFNHDEAVRAFTRASELDPSCAMAFWGISYAQGPNYNDPMMSEDRSLAAWKALQEAQAQLDNETPAEMALVEALSHRYARPEPEDRSHLEQAFADAMREVWFKYPGDSDIGTLYAEAMMVQHPWDLYFSDRKPAREQTDTIVKLLEAVLRMDPQNPGANHLYIHAVEPSDNKDRGIPAADRLSDAVPAAGHLQHMPSHIYVQTGLWDRSIVANAKAMSSDRSYRLLSPEQGIQNGYMTHNTHMLAFSAMMIGREREAIAAAQAQWDDLPEEDLLIFAPFFDVVMCSKYDVMKRFGRWDQILAEPAPPDFLPNTKAIWRAHRAIAYAAKQDFANAEKEHEAFRKAKDAIDQTGTFDPEESGAEFLKVSDLFIAGEIALQKEDWTEAIRLLEAAAEAEDSLGYGEPPVWLQPVRHTLGAVYLKAGKPADAERVYRDDLYQWRDNGWSLYGLTRALEDQGKTEEAAAARKEFERIWAGADAAITTSCMCIPEI